MTLGNTITSANLMTDESRKIYKASKSKSLDGLEYSILLKHDTVQALRELSWNELHSSKPSYDSIIRMLIRSYRKYKDDNVVTETEDSE